MTLSGIPVDRRAILYLVGDVVVALIAMQLGRSLGIESGVGEPPGLLGGSMLAAALFAGVNVVCLYVAEGYDSTQDFRRKYTIFRLWAAIFAALLLQMVLLYLLPLDGWRLGTLFSTVLAFGLLLSGWRALASFLRPRIDFRLPTLILGADANGAMIARLIEEHPAQGQVYDVRGFVDDGPPAGEPGLPLLGSTADLARVVEERGIRAIIVAILSGMGPELTRQLLDWKAAGVRIQDMRSVYRHLTGKLPIHHLPDTSLIFGPDFSGTSGISTALQRLADIVISLIGLVFALPIIAVAAVAIKLESPGPVFFLQERVGRSEKPFDIIKLRTMRSDAEAATGPVWSQGASDPRVTRVGRFLRRTRIDELPQFFNVLRGDMSVVGPRPERAHFVEQLKKEIPFYGLRFAVKPGLTGWAQVKYRYGATTEDAAEKLSYELYAIQELTPALYLLILLKTVQTVLLRPGS